MGEDGKNIGRSPSNALQDSKNLRIMNRCDDISISRNHHQ